MFWYTAQTVQLLRQRVTPVTTSLFEDRTWTINNNLYNYCFLSLWRCGPTRAMASSILRFLDHTQRRTTVGRTPLDEWSARRRDLYLTTHNTHNRQTSMPPVGYEPTISAGERPQTHALDRAATGTGNWYNYPPKWFFNFYGTYVILKLTDSRVIQAGGPRVGDPPFIEHTLMLMWIILVWRCRVWGRPTSKHVACVI